MLPQWLNWIITFNAVNIAWIFFRAATFNDALNVLTAMFDVNRFAVPYSKTLFKYFTVFGNQEAGIINLNDVLFIIPMIVLSLIIIRFEQIEKLKVLISSILIALMFVYTILGLNAETEFLYFQF